MNRAAFVLLSLSLLSQGADIPAWRLDGNGRYPDATAALDWESATKDLWTLPLEAAGNASPILIGDRLFFTAEPTELLCADRKTGKILWQLSNNAEDLIEMSPEKRQAMAAAKTAAAEIKEQTEPLERDLYRLKRRARRNADDPKLKPEIDALEKQIKAIEATAGPLAAEFKKPPAHDVNGYASYTPVSDGKHLFTSFGTGVVVATDLDGNRLWHRNLGAPDHDWGGACSPILAGGKLIVRFSDWTALDPATGKTLWTLPTELQFNAPAVIDLEDKHYLYTVRGELIRVSDGKKLPSQTFEAAAKPWTYFNTPSVIDGMVYTARGCEGADGYGVALKIPATTAELEKNGLSEVWRKDLDKNRYYSSPLVHQDILYLISREYRLQALDAATGELHYEQKIRGFTGTAYPSLTLAGEVIFIGSENGDTVFIRPGKAYEELARTKASPYRSTPIFDGPVTYLRTQEQLRAIPATK